jgi:hypothetical protein
LQIFKLAKTNVCYVNSLFGYQDVYFLQHINFPIRIKIIENARIEELIMNYSNTFSVLSNEYISKKFTPF